MQHLFIYGTLGPGGPNEHVMLDIGGSWTPGTLKGRLEAAGHPAPSRAAWRQLAGGLRWAFRG